MPTKPPIVVTARKPRPRRTSRAATEAAPPTSRIVGVGTRQGPAMTAAECEELQRRGDAADELFRELVRRATGEEYKRDF